MNTKPKTSQASSANQCTPDASIGFSKQRAFVVHASLKEAAAGAALQPRLGDNSLVLRFAHGRDLGAAPNVQVSADYRRPESRVPKVYRADVTRQEDGSYLVNLSFKRGGSWEVHLQMSEGEIQDEYVFSVTI